MNDLKSVGDGGRRLAHFSNIPRRAFEVGLYAHVSGGRTILAPRDLVPIMPDSGQLT